MTWLLTLLLYFAPQSDGLNRLYPQYLSARQAQEHLLAARVAGVLYGQDPSLLLAVAWHESRFTPDAVTVEPGRRVSCGVMTPVPKSKCSAWDLTLLGGYMEGAKHLQMWHDKWHSTRALLLAYAGGSGLVRACAPHGYFKQRGKNVCQVADAFMNQSARIRVATSPPR